MTELALHHLTQATDPSADDIDAAGLAQVVDYAAGVPGDIAYWP